MAKPLEMTFHGPFVFRFGREYAWAYAPICDEHYLNILTDNEDVALPNDKKKTNESIRTFCLTGPKGGAAAQSGNNKIITYPWDNCWPDTQEDWQYVLRFPAPDNFFGLVPEYVWIYGYVDPKVKNDPIVKQNHYARALRFRYKESGAPKFRYNDSDGPQDELCDQKNNQIDICADHFGGADPGYSIEIRYGHYASVTHNKAEYYLDAQSCFESMREKLKPCDQWKAFFGKEPAKPLSILQSGSPNGPHDCGAPVMALFDEGVSLKPAKPKTDVSSTKGQLTE
jgi:hypothetical protein